VSLSFEEQLHRFPENLEDELEPLDGSVADNFGLRLCDRFG